MTADTTLDDHCLAKKTDIWICLHRLHRDPRCYAEPERFDPERWLRQQPFTYLPFGVGPRVCIGQHFATAESTLALATMLSKFQFELAANDSVEPSAWITLRPNRPILLRLSPACA